MSAPAALALAPALTCAPPVPQANAKAVHNIHGKSYAAVQAEASDSFAVVGGRFLEWLAAR